MKKKALIIPSEFRSHVLPSFFLANILLDEYEVNYALTDKILEESVQKNGFKTHIISVYKVGYGLERAYIRDKGSKVSIFSLYKCYLFNELYWNRKKEIDNLLEKVKPDIIIVDIFNSTDFIFLYSNSAKHKVFFYNPMPSTYRIEGYPTVSDSVLIKKDNTGFIEKRIRLLEFIKSPQETLLKWIIEKQIYKLFKLSKIPIKYGVVKNKLTIVFNDIPELLMLPLEFEFSPNVKMQNQYYFGLCLHKSRIDIEIDTTFDDNWERILDEKQKGKKIIYCSFGTYFDKADPLFLTFLDTLLIAVSKIPNVFLICSVNRYVSHAVLSKKMILSDVIFFSRVPQLKILQIADLYITHGGLGGIKESISHEVPMLVYPLSLQNDQSGNGLKVEYHKIGLRGIFRYESVSEMYAKIVDLFDNKKYKKNISDFNKNVNAIYTQEYCKDLLNNLLK
jgi:hypothetical protein